MREQEAFMNFYDVMRAGMQDELEKIGGELQGFTRLGRKPISVERMIEREYESEETPTDVFMGGQEKVSAPVPVDSTTRRRLGATLATLGAGAAGYHVLRTADQDRRMGRQMRLQQQY